MEKLSKFLNKLNINYKDLSIYEKAITHLSYINENNLKDHDSYERLEFLGDAVLQKIVSKFLYENTTTLPGEMTLIRSKLVKKESLASIARDMKLCKVLRLGKGEDRKNLSDSVLEDTLEALIGAVEEDLGHIASEKFVNEYISWRVGDISLDEMKDFKTKLQELLQAEKRSNVIYETKDIGKTDEEGKLIFESNVSFDGNILGTGFGSSKKKAETEAAKVAYKKVVK